MNLLSLIGIIGVACLTLDHVTAAKNKKGRLNSIERTVDKLSENLESVIETREVTEFRMSEMNSTIQGVKKGLDNLGNVLETVSEIGEEKMNKTNSTIEELAQAFSRQNEGLVSVMERMQAIEAGMNAMKPNKDVKSAFTVNNPEAGSTPQDAKFTRVVTNIGEHYNTQTGVFTCQYPGIYVFALHILKKTGAEFADCAVRKNRSTVAIAHTNPQGDSEHGYFSSSTAVIIHLSAGDYVDVFCRSTVQSLITGHNYNSFSGFLLNSD